MPVKRTFSQITPGGGGYRKKYKAKKNYNNGVAATSTLVSDHKILSTSKIVTMRYSEQFTIDASAVDVPGSYIFMANGLYDPNVTGTGHQPRGFDQLMAMYKHYEVMESLIEVWVDPNDLTNSGLLTLSVRSSNSNIATRNQMIEHRTASTKGFAGSNGGPSVIYHKIACKPTEFLGLKSDDTVRGTASLNPGAPVYFHVNCLPLPSVDQGPVHCQARITYKVKLSEPREPIES